MKKNDIVFRNFLTGASSYTLHYSLIAFLRFKLSRSLLRKNYTIDDLTELLDVDKSGLNRLINILKRMGLVYEENKHLLLAEFINDETIDSIELWLESSSDFIKNWDNITGNLHKKFTHYSNKEFWQTIYSNKAELIKYSKAFEWVAKFTGKRLSEIIPCQNGSVLDVGTGTGILLFEYIKNFGAVGTGLDFIQLEDLFSQNTLKYNLCNRTKFLPRDFLSFSTKEKFDIIILSWVVHDLGDKNVDKLLKKIKPLLNNGGRIVIIESVLDDKNLYIDSSSLEMYLSLGEGKERTLNEFKNIFQSNNLRIVEIHENIDFRKIFIIEINQNNRNLILEKDYINKLGNIPCYLATSFGNSKISKDIDIAIVLENESSFEKCLLSIIKTIKILESWDIKGLIYPCIEFKSYLLESIYYQSNHILLYGSPWLFEKFESPGIQIEIIKSYGKDITKKTIKDNYLIKHFDLIQKITNSLVLLLNKDHYNLSLVESNAYTIANYVKKWAPVKLPTLNSIDKKISLNKAIDFYSRIL